MSTIAFATASIRKWINFLTNDKWLKTAVVFDLKNWWVQQLMEDFFDNLTAIERMNEPTVSFEKVKQQLLSKKWNV